jgi:cytochrome c biogenesis protein CcmG/thiol:disulfide interchange protein DsbE
MTASRMRWILWSLLALPLAASAVEAGSPAPKIVAAKLNEPGTLAFAELRGQVVYVDFWASWCVPCVRSMPALRTLYGKYRERGFVVIGVNKDMEASDRERFLRRFPVSFPLVLDADDAVAKAFAVKTMPSGYLIDRAGVVRQVHQGFTVETEQALAKQIEALLQEKP